MFWAVYVPCVIAKNCSLYSISALDFSLGSEESGASRTTLTTMKIGFICPNLPGHINPMSALARHLQARGHDVVFLYSSSAHGLPCIPADQRDDMNANRPEISKLEGNEALAFYCGVAAKETEAIFKSLPRMLEKTGFEALVLDPIQFFVELAAMKLRRSRMPCAPPRRAGRRLTR